MQVLERIEAVCGDAVACGELPRLLDDLGVRIGLTFRAGITNRRAARVLQGGIMAFGDRLLPCTLRTSGGRPLAGGIAPQDSGHDHCDDHVGCRDDGGHEKHRGSARSPAGGKTAPSRRRGKGQVDRTQWPIAGRRSQQPGRFQKPSSTVGDRTIILGN